MCPFEPETPCHRIAIVARCPVLQYCTARKVQYCSSVRQGGAASYSGRGDSWVGGARAYCTAAGVWRSGDGIGPGERERTRGGLSATELRNGA